MRVQELIRALSLLPAGLEVHLDTFTSRTKEGFNGIHVGPRTWYRVDLDANVFETEHEEIVVLGKR
jgi:hypothetical protein